MADWKDVREAVISRGYEIPDMRWAPDSEWHDSIRHPVIPDVSPDNVQWLCEMVCYLLDRVQYLEAMIDE